MARLTISDIESLRANSEPLSTAVAAYTSSESFKSITAASKPKSTSLSHRFSVEGRNFAGSALKQSASKVFKTRMIPLGTGRPTADFYPWNSIAFNASSVPQSTAKNSTNGVSPEFNSRTIAKTGGAYDLARGLNYGHAAGSQALVRFVTEHVEMVHNPPYKNWGTCLSSGSTSALEVALRVFCNRGDTILTERFTYPGLLAAANLLGVRTHGVEMDDSGLRPEHLELILRTWDEARGPRPTVLYTIPSGQNPTGATQPLQRKEAIYQLAEEYDLVLIEDDPYYFICTDLGIGSAEDRDHHETDDFDTASRYLANLPPSFLSLDKSGRVIRLDSLSKILAPGLRAGWVTASDHIINKFIAYYDVSTVSVSGPTQLMLWDLLDARWGHLGFISWLDQLSTRYRARLRILLEACDRYLPKELCAWTAPQHGMFLWTRLDVRRHPGFRAMHHGMSDIEGLTSGIEGRILSKALEYGVQVTMGSLFDTKKATTTKIYFRMTFAAADEDEIGTGVQKLAKAIRDEFDIQI